MARSLRFMHWLLLAVPALALAATPEFTITRTPVSGGAEILTVFAPVPESNQPVPLLSVLRDTLGDSDPANDRLRDIWMLTTARPSLLQHAAAGVPFFYWRPNLGKNADKAPRSVLDLGDPASNTWSFLAQQLTQVLAVDSNGALIRASTRRYRSNLADQRRVQLAEGLAVVSHLENREEILGVLNESELLQIQARLTLGGQMMGGLVSSEKLPEAYLSQRSRTHETRGHNWELLRQRAEANGLYFEALGLGDSPTHALLWVAREDALGPARDFDGKFLGIANPFADSRVMDWKGISVTRSYDAQGREVAAGTPGASERELIPLALYGLDYPKVPLLVVDFRATHAPKHREMLARAMADAVTGILGYSKWGNWPYMAGSFVFNFTRTRWGGATNGQQRLKAYADGRRWLALDTSLAPDLRVDLLKRLEVMGVNPLDESIFQATDVARRQFAALLAYAADPDGLPARLQRDRAAELSTYEHGPFARAGFKFAQVATLGIFHHHESDKGLGLTATLDQERRAKRGVPARPDPIYASGN
ncbi:MAG: hypothetical protein ABI811_03365 [Acidobacteriota bacterium]